MNGPNTDIIQRTVKGDITPIIRHELDRNRVGFGPDGEHCFADMYDCIQRPDNSVEGLRTLITNIYHEGSEDEWEGACRAISCGGVAELEQVLKWFDVDSTSLEYRDRLVAALEEHLDENTGKGYLQADQWYMVSSWLGERLRRRVGMATRVTEWGAWVWGRVSTHDGPLEEDETLASIAPELETGPMDSEIDDVAEELTGRRSEKDLREQACRHLSEVMRKSYTMDELREAAKEAGFEWPY